MSNPNLSKEQADKFLESIHQISHDETTDPTAKMQKLWTVYEKLIKELTKDDVPYSSTMFERLEFLKQKNMVEKKVLDNMHKTRKLCNDIRHQGVDANKPDVKLATESMEHLIYQYCTHNNTTHSVPNNSAYNHARQKTKATKTNSNKPNSNKTKEYEFTEGDNALSKALERLEQKIEARVENKKKSFAQKIDEKGDEAIEKGEKILKELTKKTIEKGIDYLKKRRK